MLRKTETHDFFGSKSRLQLVVLVMVTTVLSVSCLLFFYSRCPRVQPFVKVGGTRPRALWSRRHCPQPHSPFPNPMPLPPLPYFQPPYQFYHSVHRGPVACKTPIIGQKCATHKIVTPYVLFDYFNYALMNHPRLRNSTSYVRVCSYNLETIISCRWCWSFGVHLQYQT